MTFAEVLEEAAGEPIICAAIGPYSWEYNTKDGPIKIPKKYQGKVTDWDGIRKYLEYPYESDYGSPKCHAVYAWTEHYVLWVRDYDGATTIHRVVRNRPAPGATIVPQFH